VSFMTSQSIQKFLSSSTNISTNALTLTSNFVNPTANQLNSDLATQLLTLGLNLRFDTCLQSWSSSCFSLEDLFICPTTNNSRSSNLTSCSAFEGKRIAELYLLGMELFGGCSSSSNSSTTFEFGDSLTECITSINDAFLGSKPIAETEGFSFVESCSPISGSNGLSRRQAGSELAEVMSNLTCMDACSSSSSSSSACSYRTAPLKDWSEICLANTTDIPCIRDDNFKSCFGPELRIGCPFIQSHGFNLKFTNVSTLTELLFGFVNSSTNTTSFNSSEIVPLTDDMTNPTFEDLKKLGPFVAQVIILSMTTRLDNCIQSFSSACLPFQDLYICPPTGSTTNPCSTFNGVSIYELSVLAEQTLGGCATLLANQTSSLESCLVAINDAFVGEKPLDSAPFLSRSPTCSNITPLGGGPVLRRRRALPISFPQYK